MVGASLAVLASALSFSAVLAADPIVIPWPGEEANEASYWEAYFADRGFDYDCVKVNEAGDFTTTTDHDAIVVKAGQNNYIWQPAPAGTYSTSPQSVSHYYLCDGDEVTPPVINPTAQIVGPCGDPFYRVEFDNTGSDETVRFIWRIMGPDGEAKIIRDVPAGAVFRSSWRWVNASTQMWVNAVLPNGDRVRLITQTGAPGGWYGPCPKDFVRGFSYPG